MQKHSCLLLELQSFPLQAKRHLLIWIIHQLSPLEYSFACSTFSVIPSPLKQWQEQIFLQYSRTNVDTFQMMLGVSILDTTMTTLGFLASGDFSVVQAFLQANPRIFGYMHCHCRICSTLGTFCTLYILQEFGPVVLIILMPWMGMVQMCISASVVDTPFQPLRFLVPCWHPLCALYQPRAAVEVTSK